MHSLLDSQSISLGNRIRQAAQERLLPGILLACLLALSGSLMADGLSHLTRTTFAATLSPTIVVILLGLGIANIKNIDPVFQPGLNFCLTHILQAGIVLLGIRLSLADIATIGLSSLPVIAICIIMGLFIVSLLGRFFGLSRQLSTLIAAGTSICGCTAIMAVAPVISARTSEVSYAIACVTLFGLIATLTYPIGAHWLFEGDPLKAGIFLGTAVHDTTQVMGAGMIYQQISGSEQVLDTATVTKLARNLSMLIVIPFLSARFHKSTNTQQQKLPWLSLIPFFIVGFLLMSLLRTLGDIAFTSSGLLSATQWQHLIELIKDASGGALLIAMAAVGLNTRYAGVKEIGFKPLVLGFLAALFVGLVSLTLLINFY